VAYEALAALNLHFELVLADLEKLAALELFPGAVGRHALRCCRATLEETRAWTNFEVVEILHAREERDWVYFSHLREQAENV
jgi:hypothetical protein